MFFTNLETTNPEIFLQVENEFCYLPYSKLGPYLRGRSQTTFTRGGG